MSNYIHYNVCDEITYPILNFNGATDRLVISPHTLLSLWLLIHAVIKVNPC